MSHTLDRVPASAASSGSAAHGGELWAVSMAFVRRSLQRVRRMPSAFIPSLAMPVFQAIAFSGSFAAAVQFAGVKNSLDWFVPLAAIQGASFGALGVSFGLIMDMQNGFFDRLRMAPVPRWSLVLGPLMAALVRAIVPITLVTIVGFLGGMNLPGGAMGLAMLAVAAISIAYIAAAFGIGLTYRMRSMGAAALMQFAIFMTIFLSSAQMPLGAMRGWAHSVARINPMTNVLRMARQGFLGDVTWQHTWPGLLAIAGAGLASTIWARRGLNSFDA
jgi:ABC-2 type transport system permease protein